MSTEEKSMRDLLDAAITQFEEDDEAEKEDTERSSEPGSDEDNDEYDIDVLPMGALGDGDDESDEEATDEDAGSDSGDEDEGDGSDDEGDVDGGNESAVAESADSREEDDSGSEEGPDLERAPSSWRAQAREEWAKLPDSVKAEIHRRERDASVGIQRNSEAASWAAKMQETLRPFEQVMAMEAPDPFTAVHELARAAATLRLGTNGDKAGMIVHLMKTYEVPVEAVDDLLVGGDGDSDDVIAPELRKYLDQRLGPLDKLIKNADTTRQQSAEQQAAVFKNEVTTFESDPKNEFAKDLREEMATLLEMAAARKKEMTLQQAYDTALKYSEAHQEILAKRRSAEDLKKKAKDNARKAAAARAGVPAGRRKIVGEATAPQDPNDIRGSLMQAMEQYGA